MQKGYLQAHNIGLKRENKILLEDVSFTLNPREILAITGPNGGGKSSLLRLIVGLEKPSHGQISYAPKTSIAFMPQKLIKNPVLPMTVERLLHLSTPKANLPEIEDVLTKVQAQHLKGAQISNLSGGEQQRVMLARAFLRKPNILVLDEPAQGIEHTFIAQFYDLIGQFCAQSPTQTACLIVSHHLDKIGTIASRLLYLNKKIISSKPSKDALAMLPPQNPSETMPPLGET